jgi:hypothetical protein
VELFVGLIGLLTFMLVYLTAQYVAVQAQLKVRHMESLFRLDDVVRVSLPTDAGDMVSAAIDEEVEKVRG